MWKYIVIGALYFKPRMQPQAHTSIYKQCLFLLAAQCVALRVAHSVVLLVCVHYTRCLLLSLFGN